MKTIVFRLLLSLLLVTTLPVFALDRSKFYAGHFEMFERRERFESIFGGSVTTLKQGGHDEFDEKFEAILIEGVFSLETLAQVKRLMSGRSQHTVYFDSPGGDLNAGLELGQLMKKTNSTAVVNSGAQCKSACALAFLGATKRFAIGEPSEFGFHRQYRIVNRNIKYGDINQDRSTIDAYLRSIAFSGITAEEITTTTGLATFSESSLKERGIANLTLEDLRKSANDIYRITGVSHFEILSVICSHYGDFKGPFDNSNYSNNRVLISLACAGRVPARREPLIFHGLFPFPITADKAYILVSSDEAEKALKSSDPIVIENYNRSADAGRGNYDKYIKNRRNLIFKLEKIQAR